MPQIPIHRNNQAFSIEMKRSGNGKVPIIAGGALAGIPMGASILIGDRSPDFGGGLASIGYVMVGGKAIGSVGVDATDVQRGWLTVK
jgi:hypothetical protein